MRASLCIVLLLVPAIARAQSGDTDTDHATEVEIQCTSRIRVKTPNSVTCNVIDHKGHEDDERECEKIEKMIISFRRISDGEVIIMEAQGNTITSDNLNVVILKYNLTLQLNGGCNIKKILDLTKIVKPDTPGVLDATLDRQRKRAAIRIFNPHRDDYLRQNNQLFQFNISSGKDIIIQNTTLETLFIEEEHLRITSDYQVKVRAIPAVYFQGSWSEWSAPVNFSTRNFSEPEGREHQWWQYFLILSCVLLLLVVWIILCFRRKKIYAVMWPRIPQPKQTLVQICRPVKGAPVCFDPEAFCDYNIHRVHKIERQLLAEAQPLVAGDITRPQAPSSSCELRAQTSDSPTATSTQEPASAPLGGSSTGGEEAAGEELLLVGTTLKEEEPHTAQPKDRSGCCGPKELKRTSPQSKDEDYVTMSSFSQIK